MSRITRGALLAAAAPALVAIALTTGGCSSSAPGGQAPTAQEAPPRGSAETAGYKDGQALKKCLKSYHLSRTVLRAVYYHTTSATTGNVSPATLKKAGEQCWKPGETGLAASALRRVDSCLTTEHVTTANTGSPLADVLLVFENHSAKTTSALIFCLRS
jgi:hypothetical protein